MSRPGELPDWGDPLYTAAEMRAVDAWAIERGVPARDLMERAAEGLARVVAAACADGPIRILVGKGNNGGDGLAAARLLRREGRAVDVLAVADLGELRGAARHNLDGLVGDGPVPFTAALLDGSGAIVDAMLGTGFAGTPRGPVAAAIPAVNAAGVPVVACDVPSGVDASTGTVGGEAVEATVTATFHAAKIGLYVAPGARHAGSVEVVAIGVPRGAPAPVEAALISDRLVSLYPRRPTWGTKFDAGVVVVAGGSRGMTGAPVMAALAAQRSGAGYVRVAVPDSVVAPVEARLLEAITRGLPDADGQHAPAGVEALAEAARRAGAVVLGPGLGRGDGATEFARAAARRIDVALLVDADGLNAHAGALERLAARAAATVLTPHEAELARLLEIAPADVAADRLGCARRAARLARAVVVLKGHDSIVARPDGRVAISAGAPPALATAGSGDVLAGTIGALLAKRMEPFAAAALGVLVHARAGRIAAHRLGGDHVVAGDVIDALPAAFRPAQPAPAAR